MPSSVIPHIQLLWELVLTGEVCSGVYWYGDGEGVGRGREGAGDGGLWDYRAFHQWAWDVQMPSSRHTSRTAALGAGPHRRGVCRNVLIWGWGGGRRGRGWGIMGLSCLPSVSLRCSDAFILSYLTYSCSGSWSLQARYVQECIDMGGQVGDMEWERVSQNLKRPLSWNCLFHK